MSSTADGEGVVIDARGTTCPQPVIALARAVAEQVANVDGSSTAVVVTLLADDPAAVHDVPAWCRMRGCAFTSSTDADGTLRFVVTSNASA